MFAVGESKTFAFDKTCNMSKFLYFSACTFMCINQYDHFKNSKLLLN